MFSKYKKVEKPTAAKVVELPKADKAPSAAAPTAAAAKPASMRRPTQLAAAQALPMDKERKRKERLNDIKLDLHHTLWTT